MYSEYKLNNQGDNIQPWCTPFPFETSLLFLIQFWLLLLDLHTDFSGGRSGGLVFSSLSEYSSLLWSNQSKASGVTEVDVFLELFCFFDDPTDVHDWISGSSAFSNSSMNIWKFTDHILLKPGLENFEHYFASMWDECNCSVVWTFFDIAFLWDWNENWTFPYSYLFQFWWYFSNHSHTAHFFGAVWLAVL